MISQDPWALVFALSQLTAEELYILIGRDNGYTEGQLAVLVGCPFGPAHLSRGTVNTIYRRAQRKVRQSVAAWHGECDAA